MSHFDVEVGRFRKGYDDLHGSFRRIHGAKAKARSEAAAHSARSAAPHMSGMTAATERLGLAAGSAGGGAVARLAALEERTSSTLVGMSRSYDAYLQHDHDRSVAYRGINGHPHGKPPEKLLPPPRR